jgi:excisionase family DNA binding protein
MAIILLSTAEAAELLEVRPEHVRRMIRGGALAARRVGKRGVYKIPADAVMDIITSTAVRRIDHHFSTEQR